MCRVFTVAVAATVVLLGTTCAPAGDQITIAGSSTVKPIMDQATKAFAKSHGDVRFVVGGGGSGQGVKLAGNGEVQIGMASRNLKDKEKAEFPELKTTMIGVDGIAVLVHKTNPVTGLTTDQVRDIFTGKATNWKEVGGNDAAIVLISTNSRHGTFDVFTKHCGLECKEEGKEMAFKAKDAGDFSSVKARSVDGNRAVCAAILTQPNGISYASLGSALAMANKGAPLKLVELDGTPATEKNVVEGTYRLQRPLLVITKGAATGPAQQFIEYLSGPEGQELVKQLDFIPAGSAVDTTVSDQAVE